MVLVGFSSSMGLYPSSPGKHKRSVNNRQQMAKRADRKLNTHLVLPVVRQAAAVLLFGFLLVSIDHLTQVTEVTDDRSNKLGSCRREKNNMMR